MAGAKLTLEQLKSYFKERMQQGDNKSELWKELYDTEDKTMVTENHPTVIPTKLRIKMVIHALDPKRTKSLAELWVKDFNEEMVSYKRQGRLEGLGALQAMETMEDERTAKL